MRRKLLNFRDSVIPYPSANVWRAAVNSDVDGDTIFVERDTGCDHAQLIEIRLIAASGMNRAIVGFDADERFTAGGKLVTAEVRRLCGDGMVVRIETEIDTEKYGRWLSPILLDLRTLPRDVLETTPPDCYVERYTSAKLGTFSDRVKYLDLASYLRFKFPDFTRWKQY